MSSLSCLRGSQACLNCLLASKPLICKLAPLVLFLSLSLSLFLSLSFFLAVSPILSLCFVCPPLSFLLFCMYASILSSPVFFLRFYFPLSVLLFTVSSCQFSTMMHLCTENNDTINFPLQTNLFSWSHLHLYNHTASVMLLL